MVENASYKAEVEVIGEPGRWHANALRWRTAGEATRYAKALADRWTLVIAWRVVESEDPPTPVIREGG
jgi:hypothetical protein